MIKATNKNHGIIKSPLEAAIISFISLKHHLFGEKKEKEAALQETATLPSAYLKVCGSLCCFLNWPFGRRFDEERLHGCMHG